ncbi:hypothetical protein CDL15_Pgr015305 [Punica granatum]|uniref:Receptor ligand binding region domain-containing protein n=1 Tax=Punica granatum TaxID=22663 RepID=A0A218W0Q0_PUNGR|nr:hypothetical protein CDL15_Pgr015305 [Punica granatum]
MTASLWSWLFLHARKAEMLNDETLWIVTDRLTSLLDPVGHRVIESMMQTRVFLVHMTASLGSQIFLRARKAGMLNDETVWIVTDSCNPKFLTRNPSSFDFASRVQALHGSTSVSRRILHRSTVQASTIRFAVLLDPATSNPRDRYPVNVERSASPFCSTLRPRTPATATL